MTTFVKKNFFLIFTFFVLLLPLFDLLHPGLPITHDGQDHVARIANFYAGLKDGVFFPRWGANLNWGFGHPVLMFLYPVPSYLSSGLHFAGFSYVDSLKIVFGITFIGSFFAMFYWIRNFLGDTCAFLAAFLYSFSPYRFVDLYVRGAIGEHVAFVFPPIILYSFIKQVKTKNPYYVILASVGVAGLFLSHNAISIMFLPFIVLYGIYLALSERKSRVSLLTYFGLSILLGILCSSFFLLPAYFEGKYTLRDIVTAGEYANRFINFKSLIYGIWDYGGTGFFTVQIGIAQIILLVGSVFIIPGIFKKDKKISYIFFLCLFYLLVSVFLMLEQSKPLWEMFTTLQKFQFPWRFLSTVVFTTSVIGAIVVYGVCDKYKKILVVLIIILTLFLQKDYFKAKEYKHYTDAFWEKIYHGTTDTGESAPIWSVRFMEKEPFSPFEVVDGSAEYRVIKRKTTEHKYFVKINSNTARLKDNTLYFPGWKVLSDNIEVPVQFQDPQHRGLITFNLPKGEHAVTIAFFNTKLRNVSEKLSILGIAMLIGFYVFIKNNKNVKKS